MTEPQQSEREINISAFNAATRRAIETKQDVKVSIAGITFIFEYYAFTGSVVAVTVTKGSQTLRMRRRDALKFLAIDNERPGRRDTD